MATGITVATQPVYGLAHKASAIKPLFAYDQLFNAQTLPLGWTFTGSGTCAVNGGVAKIRGAAQKDRLMYQLTAGQYVVQAHVKNISGTGGMPSIVALDASGNGRGFGPYNDGTTYGWTVSAYAYAGTGNNVGAQTLTDVWWELFVSGTQVLGGAYSTNSGVTWSGVGEAASPFTLTQIGICQIYTAANISVDLAEIRIAKP